MQCRWSNNAIFSNTRTSNSDFRGGKPPVGSVAPCWEVSKEGTNMLLDFDIRYDHSNMAHDCQPYWLGDQDTGTKIDYKAPAKTWMKPLVRGKATRMVEIPAPWDVSFCFARSVA